MLWSICGLELVTLLITTPITGAVVTQTSGIQILKLKMLKFTFKSIPIGIKKSRVTV